MAEESQYRNRGERKHSLERYVPKHRMEYSREYNHDDDDDGLENLVDKMSLGIGRGRRLDGGRVRGGQGRVQGGWNDNRRGGSAWSRGSNDRGRVGWGSDERRGGSGGVGDRGDRRHNDLGRRDGSGNGRMWNDDRNGGWKEDQRGWNEDQRVWNEDQTSHPRNDNVNRRSDDGFDDHMSARREKMANFKPHQINGNLPRPKKNTENFNPCHDPVEMRILVAQPGLTKYNREYTNRDVLMVSDLFCQPDDKSIYNSLLKEIEESGIPFAQLFQFWHGDSHVIADDKLNWKDLCPTFSIVLDKIRDYFGMDIKATRMNWYRDSKEWKPFHHDAAAVKADKARNQNFTVAVSFGEERDAAFEHAKTKTKISMPQPNGTIYTFGRDINILWRHGILQVPPEKHVDKGRISIIAWGWIPQTEL